MGSHRAGVTYVLIFLSIDIISLVINLIEGLLHARKLLSIVTGYIKYLIGSCWLCSLLHFPLNIFLNMQLPERSQQHCQATLVAASINGLGHRNRQVEIKQKKNVKAVSKLSQVNRQVYCAVGYSTSSNPTHVSAS